MWQQLYDPLGSPVLSALVAAVPILVFLVGLTVLRLTGLRAAGLALVGALVLGVLVFGLPPGAALAASAYGVLGGLWPIGWIVLMAVWLYRVTVRAGNFGVIRGSISTISADQRIQVLLIAFCFGGFLEGAAGFGIPIAICAALLVNLGFEPLKAAMLCLVANAAFGGYGAIGIPVIVGAQQGGVDLGELSAMMVVVLQPAAALVPLLLMAVLDGRRGVRQTWPVALLIGVLVAGLQSLLLWFLGPELADIVPPLVGMGVLALFMRFWQPSHVYREPGAPSVAEVAAGPVHTGVEVVRAWSPFYVLSAVIMLWSLPLVDRLTGEGGLLSFTTVRLPVPALDGQVARVAPIVAEPTPLPAVWTWEIVAASGTAILVAVLLTVRFTRTITWRAAGAELVGAWRQLWAPLVMICLVMAVANVMNFAGMSSSIALAMAAAGSAFPLVSPVIGWVGVFVTGSVVNNNTLFASLQAVTAQQIGTSQTLLVAANTAGGVMAKVVSPQSIAIAAAAVHRTGQEATITRMALRYSLYLLAYTCVVVLALSLVLPG